MVAVGCKALPARRIRTVDGSLTWEDDGSYEQGRGRRKGMNRKPKRESQGFDGDNSRRNASGRGGSDGGFRNRKFSNNQDYSEQRVRKQVDPETSKYFSEIANLLEGDGVDLEERPIICGNALEEARGKEYELATDYIISHTMQILLEECELDHLCNFLLSSAKDFSHIAMDRSGSHVLETALKSMYRHLQDQEAYSVIEEALSKLCKVIAKNPIDVMCNCHGSHVLRSLLCLCKGVPLDFHMTKPSKTLADRLNIKPSHQDRSDLTNYQGFPDLLHSIVSGILKCAERNLKILQTDRYSSLVLQTALKLLLGDDQELLQTISILLGCSSEKNAEGFSIDTTGVRNIAKLVKEPAFSHLMEVILEVAPENLYDELFNTIFKNKLFGLSSDPCGNFVVQALISHTKTSNQVEMIWEELGPKLKDLLEMGKPGVIASLVAASHRLHTHEHECCQSLAAAICSADESSRCIVPRILFLDNYLFSDDKSNWKWADGVKIHLMGSLILQELFRFPSEYSQQYISSITAMDAEQVLAVAKDAAGARVIEAFLDSSASGKQKRRVVVKLRGHFAELSVHSAGSFTVEKCFSASNITLREDIVSELLDVRTELAKTKQGPHLLWKFDVDRFAAQPDQWRSKQASKQSAYKEFADVFGSGGINDTKSTAIDNFLSNTNTAKKSHPKKLKEMREEIDNRLDSVAQFLSTSGSKRQRGKGNQQGEKNAKHGMDDDISNGRHRKSKRKNDEWSTKNERQREGTTDKFSKKLKV